MGEKRAQIENNFTYHAPKDGRPAKYAQLRAKAEELALLIVELTPASGERSEAITELGTAVSWANAAIARREQGAPSTPCSRLLVAMLR